jgi:hypothetical protein
MREKRTRAAKRRVEQVAAFGFEVSGAVPEHLDDVAHVVDGHRLVQRDGNSRFVDVADIDSLLEGAFANAFDATCDVDSQRVEVLLIQLRKSESRQFACKNPREGVHA